MRQTRDLVLVISCETLQHLHHPHQRPLSNTVFFVNLVTAIGGRPSPGLCFFVNALAQGALRQFTQWLWIDHPTFQLGGGHFTTELMPPSNTVGLNGSTVITESQTTGQNGQHRFSFPQACRCTYSIFCISLITVVMSSYTFGAALLSHNDGPKTPQRSEV